MALNQETKRQIIEKYQTHEVIQVPGSSDRYFDRTH